MDDSRAGNFERVQLFRGHTGRQIPGRPWDDAEDGVEDNDQTDTQWPQALQGQYVRTKCAALFFPSVSWWNFSPFAALVSFPRCPQTTH